MARELLWYNTVITALHLLQWLQRWLVIVRKLVWDLPSKLTIDHHV